LGDGEIPDSALTPPEVPTERSLEDVEVSSYSDAIDRCFQLISEGRPGEALAELNGLSPPSTAQGREMWRVVGVMKRVPRAIVFMLSGASEDAISEWRALQVEAPPDPVFDDIRKMAHDWILVRERGADKLTEEEYRSLRPEIQMNVNYQRALRVVGPALKLAAQALEQSDDKEYATQMANVGRAMQHAGDEFPPIKVFLGGLGDLLQIFGLAYRQQHAFGRFDFSAARALAGLIDAKSEQIASSEAATKPQLIPMGWLAPMASSIRSIAWSIEHLSRLLQTLLSSPTSPKHLQEITEITTEIRGQQEVLSELEGPEWLDALRSWLLENTGRLVRLCDQLKVEIHPSRKALLNVAGLASTISFVAVAALLLLIGRLTGTQLNAGVVLALSAFFGLVGGFGYGALRFRGMLGSVLASGSGPMSPALQAESAGSGDDQS
jgi:hypothetical protein